MPRYTFYRHRNGHPWSSHLTSDLSARRMADNTPDCLRVETDQGRVVWRRVPEPVAGMTPHKKTWLDIDLVEWFDRAKESK